MYEKKIADPLRNIRNIAAPYNDIRNSLQNRQKQYENRSWYGIFNHDCSK